MDDKGGNLHKRFQVLKERGFTNFSPRAFCPSAKKILKHKFWDGILYSLEIFTAENNGFRKSE